MEWLLEMRPVWVLTVTLLATVAILASGRRPNVREAWTIIASIVQLILVASMIPDVVAGEVFEVRLLTLASGFDLVLRTDPLGMVFACVSSVLWVATGIYTIGYMRSLNEKHQTVFYASFALCIFAAVGLAFSGNPLTFFVFYEILTLATYPLVIHKRTEKAIKIGRMYLAYTLTAGLFLLLAVGWSHLIVPEGGPDFAPGGFLSTSFATPLTLTVLFVLFILGVAVKAGLMPVHAWLPAAMIAPTPVSALLHAVAVVKAGVFGVLRVVGYVFGYDTVSEIGMALPLAAVAAFTIIAASVVALTADNLKRRLAYSTVGQLSYVVLGAALLTTAATTGAVMHIANHAFMKITLFFCAGAIYAHLHVEKISDMKGIGRAMPVTMGAFAVGAFGLAGIPPLPGFVSKWWLASGAWQTGDWIFIVVLITSSLLNVLYFFPIIFNAFFRKSERFTVYNEAPVAMSGPILAVAVASIVLGLAPDIGPPFWTFANQVTVALNGGAG